VAFSSNIQQTAVSLQAAMVSSQSILAPRPSKEPPPVGPIPLNANAINYAQ
jgi:hypothetical protein